MRHAIFIGWLALLAHGCARPECAPDERLVGATCYELGAHAGGEHDADEPATTSMDGGAIVTTASADAAAVDAAAVDADASADAAIGTCAKIAGTACDNGLQGVCRRSGVWTCDAQQQPACDAPPQVKPEQCKLNVRDGLDNDCDGVIDELDELPLPAAAFCYG